MNRRNWILLVLLFVQLGLVAWFYSPRSTPTAAGPLLPGLSAEQVTGVIVEDNSARVALAQVDEQWVLDDGTGYPVAALRATRFISDLLAADTGRLVANTPASSVRLKVSDDDFVRRVTLITAAGAEHVLYLGTSPNAGAVHLRAGASSNVYLADGALTGAARTDLSGWIDTTYISLPPDSVQAATITNSHGTMELVRGDNGAWSLAGLAPAETLDAAALQTLASRITSISLTQPLGVEAETGYGMATPTAVISALISATTEAPRTVTLTIGAYDTATDSYVAKSSDSDYYVRIAGFQVQDFVDAARSRLVAQAPSSAPSFTGTLPITATVPISP